MRLRVIHRKLMIGKNADDNISFTKTTLFYFVICITWCITAHILSSNDVHPNPGPESESFSITSDTNDTFLFTHNFSIIRLKIQSLVPKFDILETEMHFLRYISIYGNMAET